MRKLSLNWAEMTGGLVTGGLMVPVWGSATKTVSRCRTQFDDDDYEGRVKSPKKSLVC